MGHPTDHRSIPREHRCGVTADGPASRQGTKLRDMLSSEKPNLSYAHFHHEITRDPDDTLPKHIGNQHSQVLDRKTLKDEEVVRYMSNLPSYLEKGKHYQEKALNVGVIDWKQLEKWHYSQQHMPHKFMGYSPSSSNTPLYSTNGTSSRFSRGQSHSPARQTMPRFSLQSPLEASLRERHVQDAKSSAVGHYCSPSNQRMHHPMPLSHPQKVYAPGRKAEDFDVYGANVRGSLGSAGSTGNNLNRQPKFSGKFQQCERKDSELKSFSAMVHRSTSDTYEVAPPWKGKVKILGNESAKEALMLRQTKMNAAYQDYSESKKYGVMIKPKDQSENSCSGRTMLSDLTGNAQSPVQPGGKIGSGKNSEDLSLSPSKDDNNKHLEPSRSYPRNAEASTTSSEASSLQHTKIIYSPSKNRTEGVKASSQASYFLPFPARRFSSPSKSRNIEEKKLIAGLRVVSAAKSLEDLDVTKRSDSVPNARNPSPIRRLSFAMSKMMKSAGSRENSPLRRSGSTDSVAKSGSVGVGASFSTDNSGSERSSSNSRGRSSPLRRLFDPLLKSRASSSSPEPSKKHSSSSVGTMKSSHEQLDSHPRYSVKTKSRCVSGCTTSSKIGSSSVQALLQISFKNGLPLFTFAIDNENTILAATVRKSYIPGKCHYSWAYTFFTVREVKRKSGIWLNQGGKGSGHGYVPNVVAQMKVSDSHDSPFTKHEDSANINITREFDLFEVDIGHGDQHSTDFHPTNELAAIVVKLPRFTSENLSKDGQSTYSWLDSSQAFLKESLPEKITCNDSDDSLQNHPYLQSPSFSTTVILPGGVHTVPSKGEISTLAQRWRSRGSCDCGGWDLGCQLRVYTTKSKYERKTSSSSSDEHKFQLFSQVGQDNQLMLSLAPFKESIYSVEFNSSLSLLQAFAICISFIDCKRPAELSEPSIAVEKISNEVGVFETSVEMKTSSNQVELSGRYISYPPHSPVGRV